MDSASIKTVIRVAIDVVCLGLVGFPILILFLVGEPYNRGFYCDDESIRYPYIDSTITNKVLYIVCLGVPVSTILVTEAVHYFKDKTKFASYTFMDREVPSYFVLCYKCIGIFGFTCVSSQLLTDLGKYVIGRLRPHFMDVCKPNIDCTLDAYKWKYITDFVCTSGDTVKKLKEARLSFPSGHSSFSAVSMVFTVLYVQERFTCKQSFLLKHVIQFICLAMSWVTAMSRVSNYKHHWSDVCVGLLLGTTMALISRPFMRAVFRRKKEKNFYPEENNTAYLQPMTEN